MKSFGHESTCILLNLHGGNLHGGNLHGGLVMNK